MTTFTAGIDRRAFVADLIAASPDALIVTGLGSPSYDVFAAGDRPYNFYLWGAMGGAVPTGLGLALAQPDRPVLVVTGDGEMLMGIGTLGSAAVQSPANLTIAVLDNGHFGETGMQRSHSSLGADLAAVAAGFGVPKVLKVREQGQVADVAECVNSRLSFTFAQIFIDTGAPPRALPPRDGVAVKNRFRDALGFPTF
ncbi:MULTISPECIES: thiamine pyrophosphate-dependent enzyme [unclassified Mycolicibacterium]|uniref:thiamine pyrophosphate-dependent enzyme n=1 Tax=unclassified Mycolicibacterium TaxID=2636767 RepID=UPI001F4BFFA8|nr:thiamine pyrophosphate-dependent enzyme [Mycolicibacterium sp. YH-1]UNB52182.1 thiamine pyrophosphate-dependent enzyme [Mycolicibacterium sp. YH-1]